jgi:hypothetical protein
LSQHEVFEESQRRTKAVVAWDGSAVGRAVPSVVVVAFRGTQNVANALVDMNLLPAVMRGRGGSDPRPWWRRLLHPMVVHGGFLKAC